uniref:uncharacterized protein LOC131109977 n=4 Tax=Doryrhamphus excisus TaxID=161450 RepID=UPI0025ADB60F|nr:uncharacterized protein LOC131109977 [Doryrhamphus excisus]XP_057918565.1 uncharacterized protein LOC131109977 [Doryrhamphus excisus]XP_057918566.1 uncharacterized protein LOC131109977 [Doryrhamphus excisus]XP_057920422.1 uncharacterized protein LOC131115987 isoform X1 [Doryrhamphus excisus]XP_057920423.1 uncharacterized protein LOC131115987 isoform X1 [Doryrhamphus excisus]
MRPQRVKVKPKEEAAYFASLGKDKDGFDIRFINSFKGRGVFSKRHFQKGEFLIEYRGQVISKQEHENRLHIYHDALKVFMFEFRYNGKNLCVDAAQEDDSLGRLVNDDNVSPNSKMKTITVNGQPHLCLFATTDIKPGEEITYNYGDSDWPWRLKCPTVKEPVCSGDLVSNGKIIATDKENITEADPQHASVTMTSNSLIDDKQVSAATDGYHAEEAKMCVSPSETNEQDNQTETDPQPADANKTSDCLTDDKQGCKHDLVSTVVPSLEKCALCTGPFSALKWIGVRCKVCSCFWHKSCYVKRMKTDSEFPPFVTEGASSSEEISDEEYVPDSSSHSENSGDISLGPSKSFQEVPDIEVVCTELPSENLENTPSQEHLLDEVTLPDVREADTTLQLEKTCDDSKQASGGVQPEVQKGSVEDTFQTTEETGEDHHVQSSGISSSASKINYCYICGKPQSKITRHLKTHEKTNVEVAQVLAFPKHSKERQRQLNILRNKGNHKHNTDVLTSGTGVLKMKRKPKKVQDVKQYVHCTYCHALYLRRHLWRHLQKCLSKPGETKGQGRTRVLSLATMSESGLPQQISQGVWKLLTVMKDDDISAAVRSDFCILQLAQSFFNKHGQDPTKYEYIRQKLREVGRLLLILCKEFSIYNLEDAVRPVNFHSVIQAVKKVSGFDEEKHCYKTPSLALKLGHSLQKISDIIHCRALMTGDNELKKSTQTFKKLYTSKWSELVSHTALTTLNEAHFNKPSTLPFTEDVQRLHQHLEKTADLASENLGKMPSPQVYGELCRATLAKIILFNRRRGGEVAKMQLHSFIGRDTTPLHKDVALGLTKFEQKLCEHFSRVEIRGKRGRKVAVLLSPDVVDSLTLLLKKRKECGVPEENIFLFGRPHCLTSYRGQDCLRTYANECGAQNPELLRSTQLRKHVATLSQVLNLKNHELDQVADFLGHDIRVHREYYRLPEATTQLAKISKLLLAMEKGSITNLQGKTLEEIEIEDNLDFTASEASEESEADGEDQPSDPQTDMGQERAVLPVNNPSAASDDFRDDSALLKTSSGQERTVQPVDNPSAASDGDTALEGTSKEDNGKKKSSRKKKRHEQSAITKNAGVDDPRRKIKHPWSPAEVAAVMRHFKDHINNGKLVTMIQCQQCKTAEHHVLADRTLQNIRDFVRNRGITLKRKNQ